MTDKEKELACLMTRQEAAEQILQGPLGPCPVCKPKDQALCTICGYLRRVIRNNYIKACWILGIEFNAETKERILKEAELAK
jgi:hypothetical protein